VAAKQDKEVMFWNAKQDGLKTGLVSIAVRPDSSDFKLRKDMKTNFSTC
jgi:hypothetical protein